jgi:hypothetical protein
MRTTFQYRFVSAAVWIVLSITASRTSAWSVRRQQATSTRRTTLTYLLDASVVLLVTQLSIPPSCHARNLPESTGASAAKIGTVEALVPIVRLRETVKRQDVSSLLASIPKTEREFKMIFDEYSEPISYKQKFLDQNAFLVYYTRGFDGPNRPGIESDLPILQTKQFGARNEAWVAWSDLQAELDYVKSHPDDNTGDSDIPKILEQFYKAIDSYVQLAPPDDVAEALQEVNSEMAR